MAYKITSGVRFKVTLTRILIICFPGFDYKESEKKNIVDSV